MFQTIAVSKLPQAEAIRYLEQALRVVRGGGTLSEAVNDLLTEMDERLSEARAAFRIETSASQSGRLQQLEQERDALLTGFGKMIDGQRNDPDAACKAAAMKIHENLKLYGGAAAIARMTVKGETTTIISLLRDWADKPALAEAIHTLGYQRWVDSLKNANAEYETLSIARSQERASQEISIDYTVKEKLDALRLLYSELATLLNAGESSARRQRLDATPWTNTIAAANAVSEEYSALISRREARAEEKKPASA